MEQLVVSGGCSGVRDYRELKWNQTRCNLIQNHNDICNDAQITKYPAVKCDRSQQYAIGSLHLSNGACRGGKKKLVMLSNEYEHHFP